MNRETNDERAPGGITAGGRSRPPLRGRVGAGPGRKPEWLKKGLPDAGAIRRMEGMLREMRLHTVCESASCPNLGECFTQGTATFLIMGDVCTRDCGFCGVGSGRPGGLDANEPENVADAVLRLGLSHVVVTSVTRDDLADGGARHYVATIRAIRSRVPAVTVEVLVPDFAGRMEDLHLVLAEAPDVFNHNVETVPRLYPAVRPKAVYARSLAVLGEAVRWGSGIVKTGWMVGLGETDGEVKALLGDVAEVGVDVVTIGQYLRPSGRHLPVTEYLPPEIFTRYREWGEALGLQVHAAPFVRSSFHAGESFAWAKGRGTREGEC
ncbi:MAG: lipoyl synthase [bacterium]